MPPLFDAARRLSFALNLSIAVAFLYLLGVGLEYIFFLSHYNFLAGCLPGCGAAYWLRVAHITGDWLAVLLLTDYVRPLYALVWMYAAAKARRAGFFVVSAVAAGVLFVVELAKFGIHTVAYFQFGTFWYATAPGTNPAQRSTEFYAVYIYTMVTGAYLIYIVVASLIIRNQVVKTQGAAEIESAVDGDDEDGGRVIGAPIAYASSALWGRDKKKHVFSTWRGDV